VVVRFRWLDARGAVLHRARRVSRRCAQPDPRPDLQAAGLEVLPAARPARRRYAVTVENSGRSSAGPSRLVLDLGDGRPPLAAPVAALAPGAERTVVVRGRACTAGEPITVTVDADDAVDERDEDDDVLVVTCPAAEPAP
jgi:hypothetical protein